MGEPVHLELFQSVQLLQCECLMKYTVIGIWGVEHKEGGEGGNCTHFLTGETTLLHLFPYVISSHKNNKKAASL